MTIAGGAPVPARGKFLDLKALASLASLRFATTNRIEGSYSGRHRSRQLGGAGEFADYREYVNGDDLRRLDWKVLARTGRAYLRLYEDETNLRCTLAVDGSGSMAYAGLTGKAPKLEFVQYIATALAYLVTRQQDQVALGVLGPTLRAHVPAGSTQQHFARVQALIEELAAEGRANLAGSLRELFVQSTRRGVLVVLSDFLVADLQEVFAALRLFRHRYWEVLVLHVVHPEEERLPEGLSYRFFGLEGEGAADVSPEEIRTAYEQRFAAHAQAVRAMALADGCSYRRLSTGVGYLQTLGELLVERAG